MLRVLALAAVLSVNVQPVAFLVLGGAGPADAGDFYVDPRVAPYGTAGTCANGTFNVNDGTHDDAPAINAALATGRPVAIPWPGCKLVTTVSFPANGGTIRSFGGAGPYDGLSGTDSTAPYLFVPDAAAGSATNNCVIDQNGKDGVTLENVTVRGNSRFNGTSAFCNSVGIGSLPAAFTHLVNFNVQQMAGIGGATDSQCQPTGTLDAPIFQFTADGLTESETCFGIYGNYSDLHINNAIWDNIWNSCVASPDGGGIALKVVNFRCEYTGHFDANPIYRDGVGIYISSLGFSQLVNGHFDHIFGACIDWDASGWSGAVNVLCKDAVDGAPVSIGGKINNPCNYIVANDLYNLSAVNMDAQSFVTNVKYNLCFRGTTSNHITFQAGSGDSAGGGWTTAFVDTTGSALPTVSHINAPGWGDWRSDLPTTCSGATTGMWAVLTGVVNSCP